MITFPACLNSHALLGLGLGCEAAKDWQQIGIPNSPHMGARAPPCSGHSYLLLFVHLHHSSRSINLFTSFPANSSGLIRGLTLDERAS